MTDLLTRPETAARTAPAASAATASVEPADVTAVKPVRLGWLRLVVALSARTLLLLITSMALWGAAPALIGWQPTTVVTGSMEPRISIGDIAVAMPVQPDSLALGRVILFDDPDHEGLLRLHRLVGFDEQGLLITRGDANDAEDSSHVAAEDVHGAAVLRVPMIATPIVWFHEQRYLAVLVALAALAGLMALSGLDRDLRRSRDEDAGTGPDRPAEPTTGPGAGRRALPGRGGSSWSGAALRRLPVVLLAPAVLLGLAVGPGSPAHSAYSATTTNPVNRFAAAASYVSCASPRTDSPSFAWQLDEADGATTAADASGNNRRGSYIGGFTSTSSACGTGSAITLNGTSQYLTPASTTATAAPGTFSVEAWFKTGRGGMIANFGNARTGGSSQHDRKVYITEAGRVYFGVYPGRVEVISSGTGYADNRWHHVTATLSSAGMRLYLDGALVASNSGVTTAESFNGFWRFGYDTQGGWPEQPTSGYLAGSLDNVAVYPAALTAAQVKAHYDGS